MGAINIPYVPVGDMALLAQVGGTHDQHVFIVSAVRVVAVDTVVGHRFMFVQKRPPLFCMTLVTGFIDRLPDELCRAIATVGVMTTGTRHDAFFQRMAGNFVHFQAFVLVTLEADFGLLVDLPDRITH